MKQVVLVTGGTSDIGLGLAEAFTGQGAAVVVCGRGEAALERFSSSHPDALAIKADVSPYARPASAKCVGDEMSTALPSCDRSIAQAAPAAADAGVAHPRLIRTTTVLASSLAFIDSSVVNVGLPAIARTFSDHAVACPGSSAATCCR